MGLREGVGCVRVCWGGRFQGQAQLVHACKGAAGCRMHGSKRCHVIRRLMQTAVKVQVPFACTVLVLLARRLCLCKAICREHSVLLSGLHHGCAPACAGGRPELGGCGTCVEGQVLPEQEGEDVRPGLALEQARDVPTWA